MSDSDQYLIDFGPKANCTFELCSIHQSVYGYRPSLGANVTFIVLFTVAMIIHTILGIRWKNWWFMWCIILGCTHEIIGYIGRVLLYNNPWSFVAFILQIICITQAPVFYCAAIYVTLAQTINYFSPALARFPPKYFYWAFVPCDIISLVLQGCGGGLSASSSGSSQTGVDIALAGLIFQVITLIAFSVLFVDYLVRYLRSKRGTGIGTRGKLFFSFLSFAVILILIRCIFRADELKQGYSGDLISRQDLFIALEGVLIIVSVFCLCIGHPGFIFRKGDPNYVNIGASQPERGMLLSERKTAYP